MSEQIDVIPLETYLDDQAEKLTDLCTQCGKCVEVCLQSAKDRPCSPKPNRPV